MLRRPAPGRHWRERLVIGTLQALVDVVDTKHKHTDTLVGAARVVSPRHPQSLHPSSWLSLRCLWSWRSALGPPPPVSLFGSQHLCPWLWVFVLVLSSCLLLYSTVGGRRNTRAARGSWKSTVTKVPLCLSSICLKCVTGMWHVGFSSSSTSRRINETRKWRPASKVAVVVTVFYCFRVDSLSW